MNMPMSTPKSRPLVASFKESFVTSSLILTKLSYSFFSRVKSLTSMEPETERVSLMTWFISSFFACRSVNSVYRFRPALLVGRMSRGITTMPTMASCQLMENRATRVVTTVAILLTMEVSVPEMTELTPLMSVFIRVMMSPCFSVVKKE